MNKKICVKHSLSTLFNSYRIKNCNEASLWRLNLHFSVLDYSLNQSKKRATIFNFWISQFFLKKRPCRRIQNLNTFCYIFVLSLSWYLSTRSLVCNFKAIQPVGFLVWEDCWSLGFRAKHKHTEKDKIYVKKKLVKRFRSMEKKWLS